jgi:hypothetical protein
MIPSASLALLSELLVQNHVSDYRRHGAVEPTLIK